MFTTIRTNLPADQIHAGRYETSSRKFQGRAERHRIARREHHTYIKYKILSIFELRRGFRNPAQRNAFSRRRTAYSFEPRASFTYRFIPELAVKGTWESICRISLRFPMRMKPSPYLNHGLLHQLPSAVKFNSLYRRVRI